MKPLTSKALLSTLKEFLIAWITQILYYNKVYDQGIYDQVKTFNIPVFKNRNPKLDQYFNDLIDNFLHRVLINKDRKNPRFKKGFTGVNQISVVIYNEKSNKIKRKYNVHFNDLILNLGDTVDDLSNEIIDNSSVINIPCITWEEVYTQFNSILYQHVNELKRVDALNAKRREDFESVLGHSQENDLFFKVIVELESSVNIVAHNWTRLENGSQIHDQSKTVAIGEVSLELINFDIINSYIIS